MVNAVSGEGDMNPQPDFHNLHKMFHALATITCELESSEADAASIDEAANELLGMCVKGDVLFEIHQGLEFIVPNPVGGADRRVSFRYTLSVDEVDPEEDGDETYA